MAKHLSRQFRNNLRWHLDREEISITRLAKKAGVHRVTIHKVLAGEFEPSLSLCEAIAGALGIKPDQIFANSRRPVAKSA